MRLAPLLPQKPQWLLLAATLVVVIPVIAVLVVPNDVSLALVRQFEQPRLELALGFTAGYARLPNAAGDARPVYMVTTVTQGGAFWQAGIRPGDIPVGYPHGSEDGFLGALLSCRNEGTATLRLVSPEAAQRGGWKDRRIVTVVYPRASKPAT